MKTNRTFYFMLLKTTLSLILLTATVHAQTKEVITTPVPELTDIARDPKTNEILTLFAKKADQYCADHYGTRLPTIRELALYAVSLGAEPLEKTNYANIDAEEEKVQKEISKMESKHYVPIYKLNKEKKVVVDFYYDAGGYEQKDEDLGRGAFWSSSTAYAPGVKSREYALGMYGSNGEISAFMKNGDKNSHRWSDESGIWVRCLKPKSK